MTTDDTPEPTTIRHLMDSTIAEFDDDTTVVLLGPATQTALAIEKIERATDSQIAAVTEWLVENPSYDNHAIRDAVLKEAARRLKSDDSDNRPVADRQPPG